MKTMIRPLLLLLMSCPVMSCMPASDQDSLPVVAVNSESYNQQAAIDKSFDPKDLSGCWLLVQVFPPQGGLGEGFLMRKTSENEYLIEGGSDKGAQLKVTGNEIEISNAETLRQAEARFDQAPYQIVFLDAAVDNGWEAPSRYGWQWGGKTCPSQALSPEPQVTPPPPPPPTP